MGTQYLLPLQVGTGEFLWLTAVFLFLAVVAGLVGASDAAAVSMNVAKWFVVLFVVLAVVAWVV